MENTGKLIFNTLIQINDRTGLPTGVTKPNILTDPDYIAPTIDTQSCPLPTTTTTTIP